MFKTKAVDPNQFPVPDTKRISTDLFCTILGAIFALAMFIIAVVMWNKQSFENHFFNFKKDMNGNACDGYIYSPDPNNTQTNYCVQACPVNFFPSQGFCFPNNQNLSEKYLASEEVSAPFDYLPFKWTLFFAAIMTLSFGLLWFGILKCCPKSAPSIAYIGASLLLITLGVLFLVLQDRYLSHNLAVKLVMSIVCFILALIIIVMFFMYSNEKHFQRLFLHYAGLFLSENPFVLLYIPLFLLLTLGLVALIVWQHCCFTSKYAQSKNFFNFNNLGVFEILNVLEFIWAMQFLKDAFHFCVSGSSINWYWSKKTNSQCNPCSRLFCYHWGSVVAGSFLNAFFELPTLLLQVFVCHPETCCSKLGTLCYESCISHLFEAVRTDAYAYMNMSGIPFCQSAKNCQKLCENSKHFVGYHSPMKHNRFVTHIFCVSFVFLLTWFILRVRLWNYGFWHFALIFVVIDAVVTWFINIYTDAAEGLQTSYLAEKELERENELIRVLPEYERQLENMRRKVKKDGEC